MRTGSVKQSDATEQRNSRVPWPRSRGSLRPASDVGGLGGPSGRDRTARAGAQRGRGVEGADERSRVIIAPTPKRAPGRGFRGTLSSRPCAHGNGCQANDRDDGDCSSSRGWI